MEDFYQVDREKTEQQGIGLGLPLARRIIEAHHGNLLISSIPHQGTNVSISLPLAAAI
jgi:signal transduction histidine kinase